MVFVFDHARDFGDHVAAALDFHPVADLHAQALDLVHVVQGGAADRGAADGHRLQRGHRREFSGASDLHQDVFDLRDASARGVLVGDGPARRFAGVAQFRLQRRAIDLDDDAVDFVGEVFALGLLLLDEGPDLVEGFRQLARLVDLEAGGVQGVQRFRVAVEVGAAIFQQHVGEIIEPALRR